MKLGERQGLVAYGGKYPYGATGTTQKSRSFFPFKPSPNKKQSIFSRSPFASEANTENNLALLEQAASALGGPIHFLDSTQRKALHIAAVFVNNFVNHLYTVGAQL